MSENKRQFEIGTIALKSYQAILLAVQYRNGKILRSTWRRFIGWLDLGFPINSIDLVDLSRRSPSTPLQLKFGRLDRPISRSRHKTIRFRCLD